MAAITFLISSLARLRVSALTDLPDMAAAAAGAARAGALLPRRGESRASRAATRPSPQRHRGRRPLRARVREEERALARPLGLQVSARLRAPLRVSRTPGCPGDPSARTEVRGERAACAVGRTRCEALPMDSLGLPPEDLEVSISFSDPGLDLKGTAVLHHPSLLPLLSGALPPQRSRRTPVTEVHTFPQHALQPAHAFRAR